jgi:hypothetical protein
MSRYVLFPLVCGCILWLGCGSGANPQPVAQQPAAVEQPQESLDVQLEGTWHGKMIVNEEAAAGKLTPEQVQTLQGLEMDMTFRDNGMVTLVHPVEGTSENRWDYQGLDGNKLTIKSVDASGNAKDVELFFNDANSFDIPLSTEVAELGAMRFTRVR